MTKLFKSKLAKMLKRISFVLIIVFLSTFLQIYWAMGILSDRMSSGCLDCSFFDDTFMISLITSFFLTILFQLILFIKNIYIKISFEFLILVSVWIFWDYTIFVERESSWSTYLFNEEINYTISLSISPVLVLAFITLFVINFNLLIKEKKMKVKNIFLFCTFAFFLQSCENKTQKTGNTATVAITENQTDDVKIIEQNGKSFYDWYFKNEFPNINVIKDKNGKCKLDTLSYFKELRKLGTISEKFINKEKERIHVCSEFISTIDYSEYEQAEVYEYDEYCVDFYYYNWLKSQEHPDGFSTKNIKKINETSASIDIFETYKNEGNESPLSTVFLEKEKNTWKITEIKFINREETKTEKTDFTGRWLGGIVYFNVGETSLTFFYHGQCAFTYPVKKISNIEFEMIWAREMDCKFDNGTDKTFGLNKVPEIGKPFAKYKLKNNILYVEYYYKEWIKKYTEQVQVDVFTEKYFRKNENY